ncbi:hypothetical protein [Mucilaginibacter auburnensis]|uniref:Uncharacterized protein n=1 Tax=Mucilaginibacter auburnensis TaxID=1457233 RepID=A0A2H9VM03_9SPHI|nr:hypothetical protein [Mucilaginibacter auburnensis]PJJ79346.1 hypothetical protein CLV57_2478 [Mucilaginibacter auburnensis]
MKNFEEEDIDALLTGALKKEPDLDLPHGFAVITARKVNRRGKSEFKTYLLAWLSVIVIASIAVCMLTLSKSEAAVQLLAFLSRFKYIIGSVIFVVLGIEFLDQKVTRSYL